MINVFTNLYLIFHSWSPLYYLQYMPMCKNVLFRCGMSAASGHLPAKAGKIQFHSVKRCDIGNTLPCCGTAFDSFFITHLSDMLM